MAISCASNNYNISLRDKAGAASPSINEIYKSNNIDTFVPEDINKYFANPTESYLYLVITNNDSVNATDTIEFEISIDNFN